MAKSRVEIKPNPKALGILKKVAAEDMKTFGEMALIQSREYTPVDTGNLKRSLEMKATETIVELRSRTGYGGYVHFGTSRMAARPFFALGTDAAIPMFERMIAARKDYQK